MRVRPRGFLCNIADEFYYPFCKQKINIVKEIANKIANII